MDDNLIKINRWLYPFAWLYGIGVGIRNLLFEWGILSSKSFDIPIISIGNITVGGTGKTPHTEYLIRLLQDKYKVAVLSRGYKRKSKGFVLASPTTPMTKIGDEPYQMMKKFPSIYMAVDENRCHGVEQLNQTAPDTDVILLDDAYQHRYIKPGISILLIDYHRLINEDALLPAGRLREPKSEKSRANIVIVTKCPKNLKPMDFRVLIKYMDLYPYQTLYFSTLKYGALTPVFAHVPKRDLDSIEKDEKILLLTGIASSQQLLDDLSAYSSQITSLNFADHHQFTKKEVQHIQQLFDTFKGHKRLLITTEKDATRLLDMPLDEEIKKHIYALPVEIEFLLGQKELFNQSIINYVRANSRNGILHKRKDAHTAGNGHHIRDRIGEPR